jgi:FixJ family two-component response regulator
VFAVCAAMDETSCVVADVKMPTMSGLELPTHMRTQGNDAHSSLSRPSSRRASAPER